MNKHLQSVRGQFSKGAEYYDRAAKVQKKVASKLISLIGNTVKPATILEAGCGTGYLTSLLVRRFPEARIDAFDLSPKMVLFAQQQLGEYSNIGWHVGDTTFFQTAIKYPIIVSSSSLHWVSPLESGIRNLLSSLSPGGEFLFSVMVKGTLGELRDSRIRIAPEKKQIRDLLSAKDVLDVVKSCGLYVQEKSEDEYTIQYKSVKSFLVDIHRQGLTGGEYSTSGTPLLLNEINQLIRDYQKHYSDSEGMIPSTYKVLFVRAKRGMDLDRIS